MLAGRRRSASGEAPSRISQLVNDATASIESSAILGSDILPSIWANAPGHPPCLPTTSSIFSISWMVPARATTIPWKCPISPFERVPYPVLEPFLANLIAPDVKVPHRLRDAPEAARLCLIEPDGATCAELISTTGFAKPR